MRRYLEGFGEGLVDEDDRYENGEALLGEAGDVANEKAEVERDDQQQNDHHPGADPETKRQKVHPVLPELNSNRSCRPPEFRVFIDTSSYHHHHKIL